MKRYAILIVGALVAAGCVRLGFWQVSRLHERRAARGIAEARQREPEFEITGRSAFQVITLAGPDRLAHRRGWARGAFDFERQVVVVARTVDDIPAVYLVTPLRLEDGQALLVERGWVPSPDAYSVQLDSLREPDPALVRGTLLRWTARRELPAADSTWPVHLPVPDPEKLAPRYPYPLLPWILRRSEAGDSTPRSLRPVPPPVLDNGPHLSYAIQWFAFATIAVVGSVALFLREGRSPTPAG